MPLQVLLKVSYFEKKYSMIAISEKEFQNAFTKTFEGDDSGDRTPRQTPGKLYSKASPTPVAAPKLLGWSTDLAEKLEIKYPSQTDVEILAGNKVTSSMIPYASCYAGHQFGNWAGQLGRWSRYKPWGMEHQKWHF